MKQIRLYTQVSTGNYEDDATIKCIRKVMEYLLTNNYSSASISAPMSLQMPTYKSIFESAFGEKPAKKLIAQKEIEVNDRKIFFVNERKMEEKNKSDICLVTQAGINTAIRLTENHHCKVIILITRTNEDSYRWREYGAKLITF